MFAFVSPPIVAKMGRIFVRGASIEENSTAVWREIVAPNFLPGSATVLDVLLTSVFIVTNVKCEM